MARWALLLADGVPGHENQSLGVLPEGVAPWRFRVAYRSRLAFLRAWLAARLPAPFGFVAGPFPWRGLLQDADRLADRLAQGNPPALLLSAGSGPAPICVLAARRLGRPAVTCMTPSLGVGPFDLALVPRHDRPHGGGKVVVTEGAPNRIELAALARAGAELRARHRLGPGPFVALLLGGESPRHAVPPQLGAAVAAACLALARSRGMELLVTTSRRTRPDTEEAVARAAAGAAYLCRGRTDPDSPVPGMLALSDLVVVTEDSVSMVSEAASSAARVLTVAVARKGLIPPRRHRAVLKALAAGGYVARTDAAGLVAAGARLLDGPPPPVLDDTRRCRAAVALLVEGTA